MKSDASSLIPEMPVDALRRQRVCARTVSIRSASGSGRRPATDNRALRQAKQGDLPGTPLRIGAPSAADRRCRLSVRPGPGTNHMGTGTHLRVPPARARAPSTHRSRPRVRARRSFPWRNAAWPLRWNLNLRFGRVGATVDPNMLTDCSGYRRGQQGPPQAESLPI